MTAPHASPPRADAASGDAADRAADVTTPIGVGERLEAQVAELQTRVLALEAEQRRIFEDAQRQADVMFAQYQLSQLLASGDAPAELASAVLAELARTSGAARAALWLAEPGHATLRLLVTFADADGRHEEVRSSRDRPEDVDSIGEALPDTFADANAASRWASRAGWTGVTLEERRDLEDRGFRDLAIGFVAVATGADRRLQGEHARFLALVRHELALAFRTAQLRETLARERATLSAILDGAGDAIIAVDELGQIVRLNEAARNLLDVDGPATGLECSEFLGCGMDHPGPGCGTRCPFREILGGAPPITNHEQMIVSRDGTTIPVAASYARMPGPQPGAVAVLRDLRAARALDEMRSSFVAAVSHELRTPLALVSGYVQSLLHLPLDAATERQYLERVGATVDRLGEIVAQIIDIAYIENERLALRRFPTAVADIVARATAELAEIPETRPVRLDLAPDLPLVDVDSTRIHQILVNLVLNAIKYAGPAAGITVRASRGSGEDEGTVIVSVEDDGVGIEPDERDRVFDRFYRGRHGQDSNVPGSGLGLYLCRRLIEAHGTWIRLEDRPVGTTIAFALPVARPRAGRR